MAPEQSNNNPLSYFEDLIFSGKVDHERYRFSISYEHLGDFHDAKFDPETDTLSYWYYDDGEEIHSSETFNDYLQTRLKEEFSLAKDSIDALIEKESDVNAIKAIVTKTADKLHILLSKNSDINVYPQTKIIESTIRDLFSHLISFNPSFSNDICLGVLSEFGISSHEQKDIKKGFNWIHETKGAGIHKLWEALVDKKFINSSTSETIFQSAFSNESLDSSLQIMWIDETTNRKTNRTTLFHLIDSLSAQGFIDTIHNNQIFLNTILSVFVDKSGQEFDIKGLRVTRSSKRIRRKKPSYRYAKLDEITASLSIITASLSK